MKSAEKPPRATPTRKVASIAGRVLSDRKKAGSDTRHRDRNGSETVQLRQADKLLTRIERRGEALSAGADRLLRRLS
jgi:hypothetical protein